MTTLLTMKGFNKTITPLCFTANTAGSTVRLGVRYWSPTAVNLEISTDWSTRTDYTIWNTITLSSIWDKVYMRNKNETTTIFSSINNYYGFFMSWSISASWDITYLVNKNGTDTLSGGYTFYQLFASCSALTTPPKLPATNLQAECYEYMFDACTNLIWIPELPATDLPARCYNNMFVNCSSIKISTTQNWEYQNGYRIPIIWIWTEAFWSLNNMFSGTWWTFTWTPTINTTYYTSNTVI